MHGDPHVHLYGTVTPGLALDLAEGHPVDWAGLAGNWRDAGLEPPDFAALARQHGDRGLRAALDQPASGFAAFRARYELVTACSRWASGMHERWQAVTGAELRRVFAGVGPGEYRILLPATASPAWAEAALAELGAACGTDGGRSLAISLPRSAPLRHWPQIRAALLAGAPITGIDLCGVEDEPAGHAGLAAIIAEWNREQPGRRLALLVHVGEQLRAVQPASAIRRVHDAMGLGADRLGHALAVRIDPVDWPATPIWERSDERRRQLTWEAAQAERLGVDADARRQELDALAGLDPAAQVPARPRDPGFLRACQDLVLADLAAAGTVVEVCPTSNRVVSGLPVAAHGLGRLTAAGVPWVVGSDDPGVLGTDLARERVLAGSA